MMDRNASFYDYSQRRMRQEFKDLHAIAIRLGDEMRQTCGPTPPRSISGKIIDQTPFGASQAGAPTPPAAPDVEAMGKCVSRLREIERHVFDCDYVWCVAADISVKIQWLRRNRKIDMSKRQYKHKLMIIRERLSIAYAIIF